MGIVHLQALYLTLRTQQAPLAIPRNHKIAKLAIYLANTAASKVHPELAITPIPTSV